MSIQVPDYQESRTGAAPKQRKEEPARQASPQVRKGTKIKERVYIYV